ncbi:hypothetical protein OS176_07735 [Xanthomonadaceae bacterium XH05]|nr:hypothetical protein [Xanthomonadaceae bacterium XH05]
MSTAVAFENLMTAALVSARQAKEEGDEAALMAYFDVLEVGMKEAAQAGHSFKDAELRNFDPYSLLGSDAGKKTAA